MPFVLPLEDQVSGTRNLPYNLGMGLAFEGSYWLSIGVGARGFRNYGVYRMFSAA